MNPSRSILLSILLALWALPGCGENETAPPDEPAGSTWVGRATCAKCHPTEAGAWSGSHHDLAMQPAGPSTVLGNFKNAELTHFGVKSTFQRQDERFLVTTDGPSGKLEEYEVRYTFGADPLQQFLVETDGGRLQALSLCWDSRPADDGGQRWYHLYSDEPINHTDPLHWTGPNQNWNFMCAECHSTGLRKAYNQELDTFSTTWEEVDVSCEACHGPGSRHVRWAEKAGDGPHPREGDKGLDTSLREFDPDAWNFPEGAVTVERVKPLPSGQQLQACARCHSRRGVINAPYRHGGEFLDHYRPALLDEHLYHADGQIQDEVYVWGSFLQSKMHTKGVVCTDCHDPHTSRVLATDNSLCARCHSPEFFDTPEHHHHPSGKAGTACVDCHMPSRNYMVIDARRDHSIRIPRPDLSVKLGTPNACNGCHQDRNAQWAADEVQKWYGDRRPRPHFADTLQAGRSGTARAGQQLARLSRNLESPGIVRATALSLLREHPGRNSADALRRGGEDPDPIVRLGAAVGLEGLAVEDKLKAGLPLLTDPVRAVRVEAARQLASVPDDAMPAGHRPSLENGLAEYVAAQEINADRAGSHMNLGVLWAEKGDLAAAQSAYERALRMDPSSVEVRVNLADLNRQQGRDQKALGFLEEAAKLQPGLASVQHALGLTWVRMGKTDRGISALRSSSEIEPRNARYAYVLGVALNSTGHLAEALAVLERIHRIHPGNREILFALATINRDRRALNQAMKYATQLRDLDPGDPGIKALVDQIRSLR